MSAEKWTTAQAAEYWGGISEGRARSLLAAAGLKPVGREPGRSGKNLYLAKDVRAIVRPGQGARTDLANQDSAGR